MLITSRRHTAQDLSSWDAAARYDQRLGDSVDDSHALEVIKRFASLGPCAATTSWGKDSTVLVDLIGRTGLNIPIVSLVIDGYEMPGTDQVRDMMLERHPHLLYDELILPPQPNRWWSEETIERSKYDADIGWRLITERYGPRRMTGIRAEESRLRRMVQRRWGDFSDNACRPIGRWTAIEVFAYLHKHGLPVHPAYAMTYGGHLDRRWVRVHALGGVTGADRGRSEWESSYFSDVIARSRARDAVMEATPTSRQHAQMAQTIAYEAGVPVADTQAILEQGASFRVHCGVRRWWRTAEWPPAPRWLREMPHQEPEALFP